MTPGELDTVIAIALEAADLVRSVYERPFDVRYKGPSDPVTEADTAANELICERLGRAFPGVPVVAEESPPERFANFRDSERIFFVDPVESIIMIFMTQLMPSSTYPVRREIKTMLYSALAD